MLISMYTCIAPSKTKNEPPDMTTTILSFVDRLQDRLMYTFWCKYYKWISNFQKSNKLESHNRIYLSKVFVLFTAHAIISAHT